MLKKTTKEIPLRLDDEQETVSSNFIQLTNIQLIRKLSILNSGATTVFIFLMENIKKGNTGVIISQNTIAEILQITSRTVRRHIEYLEANNFIKIVKTGTSNIYYLNEQIVWKGHGKDRKYAEFSANIIISSDEQTNDIKQRILSQIELNKL